MFDELEGPGELKSRQGKGFFFFGRKRREAVATGGQSCGVETGSLGALVQKHPSTLGLAPAG